MDRCSGSESLRQDASGCISLRFPVDKPRKFGSMGWKRFKRATQWAVGINRKFKGLPEPDENKLGT